MEAVPIRNTAGATYPFFSPDGEWVGFFTANELKKVSLAGGPAQTVCEVAFRRGATWGPDGTIVFSSDAAPGLMQVSAAGGEPQQLTVPEDGEGRHSWPRFLPDGSGVAFTIISSALNWELAVLSLETEEYRVLTEGTDGSYAASGHMVFAREASLWAAPFDIATLELTGDVAPIVEGVQVNSGRLGALRDCGGRVARVSAGWNFQRTLHADLGGPGGTRGTGGRSRRQL